MSRKEYRAEMRRKHGPDWWKAKKSKSKAAKGESEWPQSIGGVLGANFLMFEPDLCYQDAMSSDDYAHAVCLEKRGGRFRLYVPPDMEGDPEDEVGTFTKKEALAYLRKEAKELVAGHKKYGTYWDATERLPPRGKTKW